jgi:hypothetical protein
MALEVEPLSSTDGTSVDVEKGQGKQQARTVDERVVEELQGIRETLGRILQVLEYEFEQMSEETYGSED